jgi:hypothetical protein
MHAYIHIHTYIQAGKMMHAALNYACPLKTDATGLKTDGSSMRLATVGRTLHSANCFVLHNFFVLLGLRTHTRTHIISISISMSIFVEILYIYTQVYIHIYTHIHIHAYIYMHAYKYIYIYIYIHIYYVI